MRDGMPRMSLPVPEVLARSRYTIVLQQNSAEQMGNL
jgi:hypothetical protein